MKAIQTDGSSILRMPLWRSVSTSVCRTFGAGQHHIESSADSPLGPERSWSCRSSRENDGRDV